MASEGANSKLVEVVIVADVDDERPSLFFVFFCIFYDFCLFVRNSQNVVRIESEYSQNVVKM